MNNLPPSITMLMCCNPQFESAAAKHLEENAEKIAFLNPKTKLIPTIESVKEYNTFFVKKLADSFDTDFVLMLEFDSLVMNPTAWTNEFFNYDYIGAPWKCFSMLGFHQEDEAPDKVDYLVGNSGFSLGSKRLYEYFRDHSEDYDEGCPCDCYICQKKRKEAENIGLKFAPFNIAKIFSVEGQVYEKQFGAHGSFISGGKIIKISKTPIVDAKK